MLCQATKSEPATVVLPSQSPDGPYHLSAGAAHRLERYSLRPLEWFNLAVIHGPFEFYLHDDFYSEQGEACQPKEDVVDAALFPCPTLAECSTDPVRVLDFAITRWWLHEETVCALRFHEGVLSDLIEDRFKQTKDEFIKLRLTEIAGEVLAQRSAVWFRSVLREALQQDRLSLLQAGYRCLPHDEGLAAAVEALSFVPRSRLTQECLLLAPFEDTRVLDWMEMHVHEPLTREWGDLAAASGIDWSRVAKWLQSGRPLSLVALDALIVCTGPRPGSSLLMRRVNPRLRAPASVHAIEAALTDYASRDPVPRVKDNIKRLIADLPALIARADS
jgi:hypothetical protein